MQGGNARLAELVVRAFVNHAGHQRAWQFVDLDAVALRHASQALLFPGDLLRNLGLSQPQHAAHLFERYTFAQHLGDLF